MNNEVRDEFQQSVQRMGIERKKRCSIENKNKRVFQWLGRPTVSSSEMSLACVARVHQM